MAASGAPSLPSFGAQTHTDFEQRGCKQSDIDYTENTYNATDFFGERDDEQQPYSSNNGSPILENVLENEPPSVIEPTVIDDQNSSQGSISKIAPSPPKEIDTQSVKSHRSESFQSSSAILSSVDQESLGNNLAIDQTQDDVSEMPNFDEE